MSPDRQSIIHANIAKFRRTARGRSLLSTLASADRDLHDLLRARCGIWPSRPSLAFEIVFGQLERPDCTEWDLARTVDQFRAKHRELWGNMSELARVREVFDRDPAAQPWTDEEVTILAAYMGTTTADITSPNYSASPNSLPGRKEGTA